MEAIKGRLGFDEWKCRKWHRPRLSRKSGSGSASRRSVAVTVSVVPYRLDTQERAEEQREECPRQCSEVFVGWPYMLAAAELV